MEPVRQAWAKALALGDEVFAERFDIAVEPGWEIFAEVMPFLAVGRRQSGQGIGETRVLRLQRADGCAVV